MIFDFLDASYKCKLILVIDSLELEKLFHLCLAYILILISTFAKFSTIFQKMEINNIEIFIYCLKNI